MKVTLRALAAIVAGLIVSFILIVAVELFSSVVHPPPDDFGGTEEEMCRYVEQFPNWILAVVVPFWAFAAFVGTAIAKRIGNLYSSAIVGLLLLAALVLNMSMLPYPIWFKIANLLVIPTPMIAGSRLSKRRKTAGTD